MRGKRGSYGAKRRVQGADRYGRFDNGKQITADAINGRAVWHDFSTKVA